MKIYSLGVNDNTAHREYHDEDALPALVSFVIL